MLITGTSGSGKSTLGRALARALHLPYTEMDALFHGPGWTPRPEFLADVTALVQQPAWVTEWQYHQVRPLLAANAQVLVWLDYPRSLVMWRVVKRTVKRWATSEELWNGNREQNLWRSFTKREGIVRWAWDTHPKTEKRVRALEASSPDLTIVRLRSPRQARVWLDGIAAGHELS
ncbi:MAG: shikimate kinase [Trueperaceae bacterium]